MELRKFKINKMGMEDLDEILPIAASFHLNPWSRNMFIGEILNSASHCFVIKSEENSENYHPIGFICFRNNGEESELLNICVNPQYQRLGFGKELMKFYIEFCHRRGVKKFFLEVSSSNRQAIHLYQSFSFHSVGIRKKFYQEKFDALLMSRIDQ